MSLRVLVLIIALGGAAAAGAQEASQVRLIAANCANCHGTDGRSQGGMPALNGLSKVYIVLQMQDFKSGKRAATIMHQLSKGYTDAEIDAVATFFSALKN
ncbi:MAG: c-type cytochrome [Betaproteobacteria bacterium]